MWSRRVLLATMVAAAALVMTRYAPAPGYANAHSVVATSFR
jgi:hypothetical protein